MTRRAQTQWTQTPLRSARDFEAAKQHELFQDWWTTSSLAKMVRYQLDTGLSGQTTGRVERLLASLLNVPVQLAAALLLSLFICIDFRTLQRAGRTLRDTWLRDAYDEVVPVFTRLGLLVGQAMRAQGLVALCNATILFVALSLLGVEHSRYPRRRRVRPLPGPVDRHARHLDDDRHHRPDPAGRRRTARPQGYWCGGVSDRAGGLCSQPTHPGSTDGAAPRLDPGHPARSRTTSSASGAWSWRSQCRCTSSTT